jgi:NAD(P)-dependent dehydrogenase (short-subunit alcohol dehydrogenase family)
MLTVLVTSANRALGYEFARQYAAEGWHVFAACRHPLSAKNLGELAASGSIDVLEMDVTNSASIRQAAATVDGEPIDILLIRPALSVCQIRLLAIWITTLGRRF